MHLFKFDFFLNIDFSNASLFLWFVIYANLRKKISINLHTNENLKLPIFTSKIIKTPAFLDLF